MSSHEQLKRLFAYFQLIGGKNTKQERFSNNCMLRRSGKGNIKCFSFFLKSWITFQETYQPACQSDLVYQVSVLRQAFIGGASSLLSLSLQEKLGIQRGPMSDYVHNSVYCSNWKREIIPKAKPEKHVTSSLRRVYFMTFVVCYPPSGTRTHEKHLAPKSRQQRSWKVYEL